LAGKEGPFRARTAGAGERWRWPTESRKKDYGIRVETGAKGREKKRRVIYRGGAVEKKGHGQ